MARLVIAAAAVILGLMSAFVAFGFLSLGLYLEFVRSMTSPQAALLSSLCGFILAALLVLVGRGISAVAARSHGTLPLPARNAGETDVTYAALGQLVDHGMTSFRTNPGIGLGTALATGFAIGVSPGLRRTVLAFAKRYFLS